PCDGKPCAGRTRRFARTGDPRPGGLGMAASRAWHAMAEADVLADAESTVGGLSSEEARQRLERDGPNALPEEPGTSVLVLAAKQFTSLLIVILLVAAGLTLALGDYVDGVIILIVLSFNAIIGSFQEYKAEQAVRSLRSLLALKTRVLRDGMEVVVDS